MKKFYSLLAAVAMTATVNAQVFSENMGTGASGNPSVATYTGFQGNGTYTYTGTADVRTSGASSGYAGASASNCVFFAAAGGRTFTIAGLNTSAVTTENLILSFGYSSSQANKNLTVETSTNGTDWTPLTTVSNANTSWALKSVETGVPSSSTLSLRFTGVDTSSGGLRIDDVKIVDKTTLAVIDATKGKANLVKNTIVANELIFGASAKVSVVNMNGQVVKTADVSENSRLDVSSLAKGTYVVTAVVNGQSVSQKIIKK